MRWQVVILSIFFAIQGLCAGTPVEQPDRQIYAKGSRLYVCALHSLNLRKEPSSSSPVVKMLPYGTSVEVLEQDEKLVPHQMEFYQYKDTSDALTQVSPTRPQVVLRGHWIKVKAFEQEGYVFSKLLLEIEPKKAGEATEAYFVRVFHLTSRKVRSKHLKSKESGNPYTETTHVFSSSTSHVVLETEENDGEADTCGEGGDLSIPNWSFERGFVFFNAVMPPVTEVGFEYQDGKTFEYALDEVPNMALLKKTKTGISFRWFFGVN